MQKKIIALAVAALASSAAFAQTNVTVYGVADGSFDVIDVSKAGGNNTGAFNRVSANSSLLGFRGTEDLGNGLKAIFQFESAVGFDNAGGAFTGGRDSYVGLNGAMGTVLLGTLTAPTRALGAGVDMNAGATGIAANSGIIGKLGGSRISPATSCAGSTTCASRFDTRWNNAIAYASPTFSGFSGAVAYVADEDKTSEGVDNVATTRTTGYDVGVNWAGAGFKVGVAYNWFQAGNIAGTTADNVRVAGGYAGSWGKVNLLWEQTGVDQIASSLSANNKQQKWGIGGAFNIGKGEIIAQYYQALESDNVKDNGAYLAEVGYAYNMSKRTRLQATYAYLDNEKNANFDFGVNAAGALGNGATIQGMQVGLRHTF